MLRYNGMDMSAFRDPNMRDSIIAAIKKTHSVIRAQQYHAVLRDDVDGWTGQNISADYTDT